MLKGIETNEWKDLSSSLELTPRFGHSAVINNGKMYIFGGWDGNETLSDILEYQVITNTWR
jgi:N-acetylneuraminic acid mutarotase